MSVTLVLLLAATVWPALGRAAADGLTGTGSQLFTQDSPGVPDSVELDDFFGEALAASDG